MKYRASRSLAEGQKDDRALAALTSVPWATGLVAAARKTPTGAFFELRFAYEAHLKGLIPVRPFRAGVGHTDVDFRVPHDPPWNIELLSIRESDAITKARESAFDDDGIRIETLDLGLIGNEAEDERRRLTKQTPEHDMQRLISKLGEKVCSAAETPLKFPVPDATFINMLLVDVRAYLGGDDSIDFLDCRQILYGARGVPPDFVAFDPNTNEPLRGLWDPSNPKAFAKLARARIQVVGFVHEEEFTDDEIRQVTRIYRAPGSQVELANNPLGWPEPPANRAGLRARNSLWNLG